MSRSVWCRLQRSEKPDITDANKVYTPASNLRCVTVTVLRLEKGNLMGFAPIFFFFLRKEGKKK